MVSAAHFFATAEDEADLCGYIETTADVLCFPFGATKLDDSTCIALSGRGDLQRLGILNRGFGAVRFIRPASPGFRANAKVGVMNHLNWQGAQPGTHEGIIDWNATPALYWSRGHVVEQAMTPSDIGSQADSMHAISDDYARWVNRVMNWIKRRGKKVSGRGQEATFGDYDIDLPFQNAVYALPGALNFFKLGGRGQYRFR